MSLLLVRQQERAFEWRYRRHVGDVYRYALVVLRDPRAAESVTRETFVNGLRAHRRGERPRSPFNRLLGIAHDACAGRSTGDDDKPLDAWDEDDVFIFLARQALGERLDGPLSCHEAERAVSRQLDGQLPRSERKLLRAHLRSCADCARIERLHLVSRAALRSLESAPVPDGLRVLSGSRLPFTAAAGTLVSDRWESSTREMPFLAGRFGRSARRPQRERRSSR